MKYELILIPDSDDQRKVEDIHDFDEMKRVGGKLDSYRHHVFDTEAERKAYQMGVAAMAGRLGDGVHVTKDTEEQTFRITWRHEVFVKAIDSFHAEGIWSDLNLGDLDRHGENRDIICHEHVEIDSILDEEGNDLLNQ